MEQKLMVEKINENINIQIPSLLKKADNIFISECDILTQLGVFKKNPCPLQGSCCKKKNNLIKNIKYVWFK